MNANKNLCFIQGMNNITRRIILSLLSLLTATSVWADVEINETTFPDETFRQWVLSHWYGADGILTDAEIADIYKIELENLGISSLKGIEYFTALKELFCGYNQLTTLDVSQNTALTNLYCYNNQLTTLDVSHNTALINLGCPGNQLTTLDVSNNTVLTELWCDTNQLTTLDISNNTELKYLFCFSNQLTELDVSQNTALEQLTCGNNQLTTLDVSHNTALTTLDCRYNPLTTLDVSHNTALTELYCGANQLTTLDVSQNTALTSLSCDNNQLTTLDISNNTALTGLNCGGNQQTTLDISNNTALTRLYCQDNQLTTLDVSQHTALDILFCVNNKLTTLDVSNNTALTELSCGGNPLTTLDVSNNTALTWLECSDNELTTLDVSQNTALTELSCHYNHLTTLDISNNTALTRLKCYENQLTTLDVSNNTALTWLECFNNQLTALNVSNNTALRELSCYQSESGMNKLLYVEDKTYDRFEVDGWNNIIRNGQIEDITIYDNEPLYVPKPFTAQHISYTHNFSKATVKGVASGWESLVLPFDVQSITCDSVGIRPFGTNLGGYSKFWLAEVNPETGFTAAKSIEANKPYILAMPNSTEYVAGNITGSVTFSATNATVQPTSNEKAECATFALTPCWQSMEASDTIYVLNDEEYVSPTAVYPPGSVFVRSVRAARPFEAYYTPAGGAGVKEFFPISEMSTTGIMPVANGKWTTDNEAGSVYDLSGRRISTDNYPKGLYIRDGRKIMVK